MERELQVKRQVREFYDQVGWKQVSEGIYQNARYEDLRPVSRQYIHRCHLRVNRHLKPHGRFLLDAGSGPIQYPEYLEYSRGYHRRVCVDISITALDEARKRIGEHGLYVVADVAHLPFQDEQFDGVVSLHTIHHLPAEEPLSAYRQLYRVLAPEGSAVVVNGWQLAPFMRPFKPLYRLIKRVQRKLVRNSEPDQLDEDERQPNGRKPTASRKTFVRKQDAAWLKREVGAWMPVEIFVWRSVNTNFLRTFVHTWLGGRLFLKLLYWLEERFPHFMGENGQYPLIVIRKAG